MNGKKFVRIGQLLKPVGTSGELKVEIEDDFIDDFVESDHVFVKINGHFVPCFIENIRETNHILVKFEEVDNPESASAFTLKEVFMREKDLASTNYLDKKTKQDWLGFSLYDNGIFIGTIEDIEIYPQQLMASVFYKNKNVLIPLVDELITSVQGDKKVINMTLPEGLLAM